MTARGGLVVIVVVMMGVAMRGVGQGVGVAVEAFEQAAAQGGEGEDEENGGDSSGHRQTGFCASDLHLSIPVNGVRSPGLAWIGVARRGVL